MFTKKKMMITSLLSALVVGIVCSMIVYTHMLQASQMEKSDLYGTYQFNNGDIITVIPPSEDDASENEFEWYDVDNQILAQATCEIDTSGFITFYVNKKSIAILFIVDEKCYFVENSLEPQKITKISEVSIVSTPD